MRECHFCTRTATAHEPHCVHDKPELSPDRLKWKEWYEIGKHDEHYRKGPLQDDPIAIYGYHKGQSDHRRELRRKKESEMAQMSLL